MATKNSTILGKIWTSGTSDYQQRVPDPTQSRISQTMNALFDPMNRSLYNQFMDSFINLIAQQKVHGQLWKNPLSVFKGSKMLYGATIQESAVKWIKAHAYDDASETLLKLERPEAEVWYHTVNRQDRYDISVNRQELMQAFRDEYGLNKLVNAIMNVPISSDNIDEFNMMLSLISMYDQKWGFYKQQVSALPTDEATGKEFLTSLRTFATLLKFPSTQYNAADIDVPVFAQPEELVLIVEAGADASVDVNTLASVFQLDKADVKYRKIVVPEIPIEGAFALLTTDAFFVVNDKLYETDSFYNPQTLSTNYYLHHWEVVSCSPFVPAILYTTEESTTMPVVSVEPTGFTLEGEDGKNTVEVGGELQLVAKMDGLVTSTVSGENGEVEVAPNSYTYELNAMTPADADHPEDEPAKDVQLNSRTYIDGKNVLHVQKSGLKAGDVITITAKSTYYNPNSAAQTDVSTTLDITIE